MFHFFLRAFVVYVYVCLNAQTYVSCIKTKLINDSPCCYGGVCLAYESICVNPLGMAG